jgi:hypothetical protein
MRLRHIRVGDLGTDQPKPRSGKAALLEFLPTAAETWIIATDAFERILKALAAAMIGRCLSPPPLLVLSVLLAKAVPSGQLFYRIAE